MAMLRIFPDAGRVEAALREAAVQDGWVDGAGFVTLSQFIERMDGAAELGCRPVGPEVARLVLFRIARKLGTGPFGAWALQPRFALSAWRLFSELKAGLGGPSSLIAAAEIASGNGRERLRWLGKLFERCEAELSKARLADPADAIRGATERLRRALPEWLRRFDGVEIAHVHDLLPNRLALLEALWRRCEQEGLRFAMRIPAGLSEGVDAAVDRIFETFERSAADLAGESLVKEELDGTRPLVGLGRTLFSGGRTDEGATQDAAESLALFSAASPRAEAQQIALRVRGWISEGIPPEGIAVAFRGLGSEAEAVSEALAELGIPARARLGLPLLRTALGRKVLDLALVVEEGFPAREVARLLGPRLRCERASPGRWLLRAGVRDDRLGASADAGAYAQRLGALGERLEAAGREGEAREVRRLREGCAQVIEVLSTLPEHARLDAHLRAWSRAVERLGLNAHPSGGSTGGETQPDALDAARLAAEALESSAWEASRGLAEALSEALAASGAAALEVDRRTFHALLHEVAADWNLLPPGPRAGTVRICEVRELVGLELDRVALGGVSDGRFPARASEDGLLSDAERAKVNQAAEKEIFRLAAGEGDFRVDRHLAEDRWLFFQALGASRGQVTVSYARTDEAGREQFPSAFLDELRRRTGVGLEAVPHRVVPEADAVHSERALQEWAALEGCVRPEFRMTARAVASLEVAARFSAEDWWGASQRLARIEDARGRFFADEALPPGPFTGQVMDAEVLALLAPRFRFGPEHPVSASALGALGNCHFQGLLRLGMHLQGPEEVGEDLDPRGKGTFWHALVERLFPTLLERGLLGRPFEEVPEALIDACLESAERAAEQKTHLGHRALRRVSSVRAKAMAKRLIDGAGAVPFGMPEKMEVEVAFGGPESPVLLPPLPGEEAVYLRGVIDRADRTSSGWGVIDYKSGKVAPKAKVEELLRSDFQLPIYLQALRARGADGPLRAMWVSMKAGEAVPLDAALADASIEDVLATDEAARVKAAETGAPNLANAVHHLLAEARRGDFRPRPHDCGWCDLQSVCRIGGTRKVEEE